MDYFELLKGSGGTKSQEGWFSDLLSECRESAKEHDEQKLKEEKLTAELVIRIANSASAAAPGERARISDITREVSRETESTDYAEVSKFVRKILTREGWDTAAFESKVNEAGMAGIGRVSKEEIAQELYGKPHSELNDEEKEKVHRKFVNKLMGRESKVNELDEPDLERPEKARKGGKPLRPLKRKRPQKPVPDQPLGDEPETPKEKPREEPGVEPEEKPKLKPDAPEVPEIDMDPDRDDVPPPPEEIQAPEQPIEMRKEYLGRSEETHFYFVTLEGDAGAIEDLVIADQEGVKKYSAKDRDIEVTEENIADFIINAIRDIKIAQIERSIFMKYIYPRLEQYAPEEEYLEPQEEEVDEIGKEKSGRDEEEEKRSRRIAASKLKKGDVTGVITLQEFEGFMERKKGTPNPKRFNNPKKYSEEEQLQRRKEDHDAIVGDDEDEYYHDSIHGKHKNESKNLIEMQVIDGMGNAFSVDLASSDRNGATIVINGKEFSFSADFSALWTEDGGKIGEEGLEELALDALAMMDEEEYQALVTNQDEPKDVSDMPKSVPGEPDWPLKDRPEPEKEDSMSAPPIASGTDDVDLSKAEVVQEPERKPRPPEKYPEEEQGRQEDYAAIAGQSKYRPKKPIPDQPAGDVLSNENKNETVKGDNEMNQKLSEFTDEQLLSELADRKEKLEGINPDPKDSPEKQIKKLSEEEDKIEETDIGRGAKALVQLLKDAVKAGDYAKVAELATKAAEIEAMVPPEAEAKAEEEGPVDKDAKAPEKKKDDKPDDKPEKKDDKPDDKPEKKDDKPDDKPEKKDDLPAGLEKDKHTDEKKSPPKCEKCDKSHWPFDKCSESGVDEKKDIATDAEMKRKFGLVKSKKDKEAKAKKDKEAKAKKDKEAKAKKAKKESRIPVESVDDISERKSTAMLKTLLGMND